MSNAKDELVDLIMGAAKERGARAEANVGKVFNAAVQKMRDDQEKRIEMLKQKARRQIDLAYNKALEDAAMALGFRLDPDGVAELVKLKRTPREVERES